MRRGGRGERGGYFGSGPTGPIGCWSAAHRLILSGMVDTAEIGDRFSRLTVIGFDVICRPRKDRPSPLRRRACRCRCDCGSESVVPTYKLQSGHTTSCGCRQREVADDLNAWRWKAEDREARKIRRNLRQTWWAAIDRCHNAENFAFSNYGGRGIAVCAEWRVSFDDFHRWSLENGYYEGQTLDRQDNDGPYSPENCRWANYVEQNRNRRDNRMIEAFGERKCISAWLEDERCVATRQAITYRLSCGMGMQEALTLPLRPRGGNTRSRNT